MKKLFIIPAVTFVMIACDNSADEKARTEDSLRIADSLRKADSAKMMNEPPHMAPPDTTGRRPRD